MRSKRFSIGLRATVLIFTVTLFMANTYAANETVQYSVHPGLQDGTFPEAGLIFDAAGNLYGTTSRGGTNNYGTVFQLTPQTSGGWTEKVLYRFGNGADGAYPYASLIFDGAGNLYGTTTAGGTSNQGTVFELTRNVGPTAVTQPGGWTETVLHSFNGTDGAGPLAGLIFDGAGNLYGTTSGGGTHGGGTVFELTPQAGGGWTETVLHSFNGRDGSGPYASLVFDATGNLYGTTSLGGAKGWGTVFELTPQAGGGWSEQVLYSFRKSGEDGIIPLSALIFDSVGNLYGTTNNGGGHHGGVVFELTPQAGGGWEERTLYSFGLDPDDGSHPVAGVIFDANGNLYGTTDDHGRAHGTAFELTPRAGEDWKYKVLHRFNGTDMDGASPQAGLIFDALGNLYGTTKLGGTYDSGTAFELTPQAGGDWTEQVLYSFGGTDGASLYAGLIIDCAGDLYGTTSGGGTYGYGTAFEITALRGWAGSSKRMSREGTFRFAEEEGDGSLPSSPMRSPLAQDRNFGLKAIPMFIQVAS